MLMRGGGASFAEPPQACLPLGLADLATFPLQAYVVPFRPGDQISFYTDGVSEARDRAGQLYPLELRHPLLELPDPQEALDRFTADVIRHADGMLHDDAAMLLLRHGGQTHHADGPGAMQPPEQPGV